MILGWGATFKLREIWKGLCGGNSYKLSPITLDL